MLKLTPVFNFWTTETLDLLKMFWSALDGTHAIVMPHGYNSLLVISEVFLMCASVVLFIVYAGYYIYGFIHLCMCAGSGFYVSIHLFTIIIH